MELVEGAWAGQSCTVIGGGPSLKGFDWELLRKKKNLIAINMAFQYAPWADICFVEDSRFMTRFGHTEAFGRFSGLKIWHVGLGTHVDTIQSILGHDPAVLALYEKKDGKYWSSSFGDGLSTSSNASVGAINVADLMGADPIYLMGIDCRADTLNMANFHQEYPKEWAVGAMQADNFKSDAENWIAPKTAHRKIVNVVNPAFESRIDCWPKITLKEYFNGT